MMMAISGSRPLYRDNNNDHDLVHVSQSLAWSLKGCGVFRHWQHVGLEVAVVDIVVMLHDARRHIRDVV